MTRSCAYLWDSLKELSSRLWPTRLVRSCEASRTSRFRAWAAD